MRYRFKARIQQIFDGLTSYSENRKRHVVFFDCPANTISFDSLTALARILGTTKINFTGRTQEFQYGTGTWGSDNDGEIVASEVDFAKG